MSEADERERRARFQYLTSLVGDGGMSTSPFSSPAFDQLQELYGGTDDVKAVEIADLAPPPLMKLPPLSKIVTAADDWMAPGNGNSNSDGGDGGGTGDDDDDGASSGAAATLKNSLPQPTRRIRKRRTRSRDRVHVLSRACRALVGHARVGVGNDDNNHNDDDDDDDDDDAEFVVYEDESLWSDEARGVAPTRARVILAERNWRDELHATLRGRRNANATEVVGGPDPVHANVAPELGPEDPRFSLFNRGHEFGHATDAKTREVERAAFVVLENIHNRVKKERSMLKSYWKLLGYSCSMLLVLAVVSLQWDMGTMNERLFTVLSDQLFRDQGRPAWSKNDAEAVEAVGYSKGDITLWLETNLLDNIFVPETCGDSICNAPDEFPYYRGHAEMREFVGCEADCGSALTKRVTVNFFDPWKLQAAYDQVANAAAHGWNSGDGNGLMDASKYKGHDTSPIAGWNVCSRNLKEEGFFEPVCLFDGDIFIDGLPYRSTELEDGSDDFAGSFSFDLFDGLWEVRIAFEGFSWQYNGQEVPIAFPSVRGELCVDDVDDRPMCRLWDPCPSAHNCSGEWWQDGTYYRFEPAHFDEWDEKYAKYAQEQNLVYLSKWLNFNETYRPSSQLNTSRLDDDQWQSWACLGAGTHSIILTLSTDANATDNAVDDAWNAGWDGWTFELFEKSSEGTFSLVTSAAPAAGLTDTIEQYMCPEKAYAITVSEPAIPSDIQPSWEILDTVGARIARGVGSVVQCDVYGSIGAAGAYCQSNPTLYPTPNPSVVPDTTYTVDTFDAFDPGIWIQQCDSCLYTAGGLLMEGINFQRSYSSLRVRKILLDATFETGDNPVLVLTNQEQYMMSWDSEPGAVKIGFMDTWKFIKGQTDIIFCNCPITVETKFTFEVEVTSEGITFTDNVCSGLEMTDDQMACDSSSLFLKDSIGSFQIFAMIGSLGIYMPTSRPTPVPTISDFPTIMPTTSAPTISRTPSEAPTPVPSPDPTSSMPTASPLPSPVPTITPVPTSDQYTRFRGVECGDVLSGTTMSTESGATEVHYFEFTFDKFSSGNLEVSTCHEGTNLPDTKLKLYGPNDCGGTLDSSVDDSPDCGYMGGALSTMKGIPMTANSSVCIGLEGYTQFPSGDYSISFSCDEIVPSPIPSPQPSMVPTAAPTLTPSLIPTPSPSMEPSEAPSSMPSVTPYPSSTPKPTGPPTLPPTPAPTLVPSPVPSPLPTIQPSAVPSLLPTSPPSLQPSLTPTIKPTISSTPTRRPTPSPTSVPSPAPSRTPTPFPSSLPTISPSSEGRRRRRLDEVIYTLTSSNMEADQGCAFGYELTLDECEAASVHYGVTAFYDMSFGFYAQFTPIFPAGCAIVRDETFGGFVTYNSDPNAPACESNPYDFEVGQQMGWDFDTECICFGSTGTDVLYSYFSMTGSENSHTFVPSFMTTSLEPSMTPVPSATQTPSLTHEPTRLPAPKPTSEPSAMPTLSDSCVEFEVRLYTFLGNGWSDGMKLVIADREITWDWSEADGAAAGFNTSQSICLLDGKTFAPYVCGGVDPSLSRYEIVYAYDGVEASAWSPAAYGRRRRRQLNSNTHAPTSTPTASPMGWCQACAACTSRHSVSAFTVKKRDADPSGVPTSSPTQTTAPSSTPSVSPPPSPAPSVTSKPTATAVPTITNKPTTRLQASRPPSFTPTSLPTAKPTTPSPTVTFKPTTYEHYGGRTIWTGWGKNYVAAEANLPFSPGRTSCHVESIGDGLCDDFNNDMACDFDGGDCCADTCFGDSAEGLCTYFNCKDPHSVDYWPFISTNGDICYPFTTQRAFLDILDAKNRTATFHDLPSLSCPDCSAYNDTGTSYLSVPFQVETASYKDYSATIMDYSNYTTTRNGTRRYKQKTITTEQRLYSMFPVLNETRRRTFLGKNSIIGGVVITQSRVALSECPISRKDLRDFYGDACASSANEQPLRAPFGVDPTFVSTSSLFRATNKIAAHYSSEELNNQGIPFGFYYDSGCGADCSGRFPVKDFPIVFDTNFNVSRVSTMLTLLRDGNYIDAHTSAVMIRVPMLSFELGRYALVSIEFKNVEVGSWNMEYKIDVLPERLNNWNFESARDVYQSVLEVLFLISWLFLVTVEFREARQSIARTGFPFAYVLDFGNLLDWVNYALQVAAAVAWAQYVSSSDALKIQMHYDVYGDYMATARLTKAAEEMGRFQKLIDDVQDLVRKRSAYSTVLCCSLLVTTLQTLKNLDFHPKLGIVTKTIRGAAADLSFFVLLFLVVQTIYAFLAVLVFGSFSGMFSSFGTAFVTNQYFLLGIADPQDSLDMSPQPLIATTYYWSYMLITFFILLNALLAIIVDSYAHVKHAAREEGRIDPLRNFLTSSLQHLVKPEATDALIAPDDLAGVLHDLYENARAQRNAYKANTAIRVLPLVKAASSTALDEGKATTIATILRENLDGTYTVLCHGTEEENLPVSRLQSPRLNQVRLPCNVADRIMFADVESMKTVTRFYLINKGTKELPKPALLDQLSLVLVLKTLVPAMHMKIALAISVNILIQFGHNADLNNDGVISPSEWEALQRVLDGMDREHFNEPTAEANKTRLVTLMLM